MSQLLFQSIQAAVEAGKSIMEVYATDFGVEIKIDQSPVTLADKRAHDLILDLLSRTDIPVISEEGMVVPFDQRKTFDTFWLVDPLDGTKEFVKRNDEFTVNIALIKEQKAIMGVIYAPVFDLLYFTFENKAYKLVHASKIISESLHVTEFVEKSICIPIIQKNESLRLITSRSYHNMETRSYIEKLRSMYPELKIIRCGSSLKLCKIAEGLAEVYPRFGNTSEWDIAAGHAIISACGGRIVEAYNPDHELLYNKESMNNPPFIAYSSTFKT